MTFSRQEKFKCVERELAIRRKVYAQRVRKGQMKEATADREIALMQAIMEDYGEDRQLGTA